MTESLKLHTRVVRVLGSSKIHVVEVPESAFIVGSFIDFYQGVEVPVATRCGAVLRDASGGVHAGWNPGDVHPLSTSDRRHHGARLQRSASV